MCRPRTSLGSSTWFASVASPPPTAWSVVTAVTSCLRCIVIAKAWLLFLADQRGVPSPPSPFLAMEPAKSGDKKRKRKSNIPDAKASSGQMKATPVEIEKPSKEATESTVAPTVSELRIKEAVGYLLSDLQYDPAEATLTEVVKLLGEQLGIDVTSREDDIANMIDEGLNDYWDEIFAENDGFKVPKHWNLERKIRKFDIHKKISNDEILNSSEEDEAASSYDLDYPEDGESSVDKDSDEEYTDEKDSDEEESDEEDSDKS